MFSKFVQMLLLLLFLLISFAASEDPPGFIFNGFKSADTSLIRDGMAEITPDGLLRLTNHTEGQTGHAFYLNPIQFKNPTSDGNNSVYSFSTTFVFAIDSNYRDLSGHGIAFFLSPSREFPGALPREYLGLFNQSNNGNSSNHVVAVELDTIHNTEFDIDYNHVGIDINDLKSIQSKPAMYFSTEEGRFLNLSLISGKPMQVWVEYDSAKKQLDVTLAPFKVPKPNVPLLSLSKDLSPIILESMYVGFSSSTGTILASHYILGWSFKINEQAEALDLSVLPKLPLRRVPKKKPIFLTIGLPIIVLIFVLIMIPGVLFILRRKRKFVELVEDWEQNYRTIRFSYKDLYVSTKGFREKEVVGVGGFGKVFKGVLPTSKIEVAVKKVSHDSRQGLKEFIAEIDSVGQIRHRNLVQLFGYCRCKGELLLVYDFMPNGSLDKFLFGQISSSLVLNWNQRFKIIKGVASGLLYLHEGCEQVVIHRDVKASNVLLDGDMDARLSDFGLARLYDRGSNPQTTNVVGTLGYIAPELTRTGRATTATDVFAFGAFLLEVACGRRPIKSEISELGEDLILVDWVFNCWSKGSILEASDPKLSNAFQIEEMELVLTLGLLCSHSLPMARPNMKQVVQYLDGDIVLPARDLWFNNFSMMYSCSVEQVFTGSSIATESILSGGR